MRWRTRSRPASRPAMQRSPAALAGRRRPGGRDDEEMPRVGVTRRRDRCCSRCSCSRRSPSSTSCCRSSAACGTPGIASTTATPGGSRSRSSRGALVRAATSRSSGGVTCPTRVADRLARELPDHDGRPGRDAAVRRRRRRRRRGDGLGAAPLGMERREVAERMVAFLVLLYGVYMAGDGDLRRRPRHRPVPGRRLVRDHDRAGDRRRRSLIVVFLARSRWCRTTSSGAWRAATPPARRLVWLRRLAAGAGRRWLRAASHFAWYKLRHSRLGAARGGLLVGLRHRGAVGDVPRVRPAPPFAVIVHGVLRRHARATCCRCPAASAGSTAA